MKKLILGTLLLAAATLAGGCSTAQAQCPGGNCSRGWGVWSPWVGGYYWQSPCAGGKCRTAKPAEPAEAEEPKAEEPAPEAADEAPVLVEEPVIEAQPSICEIVSDIVNRHRERMGLPTLAIDPVLCRDCESHSEWMARGGGFQHGYYTGSRECIAQGVRSPEAVVNLWLGSSGHRAIVLGGGKTIGVGCSGSFWTLRVR